MLSFVIYIIRVIDWISISCQSHTNHTQLFSQQGNPFKYDSHTYTDPATQTVAHAADSKTGLHHPSLHLSGSGYHHGPRVILKFVSCFQPALHRGFALRTLCQLSGVSSTKKKKKSISIICRNKWFDLLGECSWLNLQLLYVKIGEMPL